MIFNNPKNITMRSQYPTRQCAFLVRTLSPLPAPLSFSSFIHSDNVFVKDPFPYFKRVLEEEPDKEMIFQDDTTDQSLCSLSHSHAHFATHLFTPSFVTHSFTRSPRTTPLGPSPPPLPLLPHPLRYKLSLNSGFFYMLPT